MSDLASFLLIQIAADEEVARLLSPTRWYVDDDGCLETPIDIDPDGFDNLPNHHNSWYLVLDPARVLAECAAKRRIVEGIRNATSGPVTEYYIGPMMTTDSVLRLLAQPYRDREGYRQEWDVQ